MSDPIRPRQVLITGGAGFIGSRLAGFLAAAGDDVCVFDNLSSRLPLPPIARGRGIEGDVRDEAALEAAFAEFRPSAVVHLAAVHHIPTCELERAYSLDVNVTGTERVLAAAERHGVEHLVLASSGAVYDTVEGPLREATTRCAPHDNYALAKTANEQQARFWGARTGQTVTVARIFNTIGPGDPNAHLVPDILEQVRDGQSVVRLGNTSPRRDYVWVEDVARALQAAVSRPISGGTIETVNVCSGVEYSVAQIVEVLGELLSRRLTIEVEAARVRRVDRAGQLGDPAHARALLGWTATTPLRDALAAIVRSEGIPLAGD